MAYITLTLLQITIKKHGQIILKKNNKATENSEDWHKPGRNLNKTNQWKKELYWGWGGGVCVCMAFFWAKSSAQCSGKMSYPVESCSVIGLKCRVTGWSQTAENWDDQVRKEGSHKHVNL